MTTPKQIFYFNQRTEHSLMSFLYRLRATSKKTYGQSAFTIFNGFK